MIGIRVNPQVGVGTIAAMSTATRTSKFGIALDDPGNRARILAAYRERPWLTCVHTHVGSQGCPLELIAGGVAKAVALAQEINVRGRPPAGDNGRHRRRAAGQLRGRRSHPTFADYAAILREAAPALFSGEFQVITEFGRSVMAKNGFIVARVEYTKVTGGHHIAITHAGAQVATRTVFMPELWPIRVSALDPTGRPKTGPKVAQDVAGPCCFAGDIVASRRDLPLLEPGDWVLLHDTGAYYFSTPFVYNSLPRIAVHGFRVDAGQVRFELLRREESLEEVVAGDGSAPMALSLSRMQPCSWRSSSGSASCVSAALAGLRRRTGPPRVVSDALQGLRGRSGRRQAGSPGHARSHTGAGGPAGPRSPHPRPRSPARGCARDR